MSRRSRGERLLPLFILMIGFFLNIALSNYSGNQGLVNLNDRKPVAAAVPIITQPTDLLVDLQTARGNYTATDQFNNGTLSPWYDVSQTGCSVTVASNVAGFARALKYTDPNTSWRANARRDVPEAPTVGWAEFWYYNDDPVDWVGIQFQAETLGVDSLAVIFQYGNIYAYNGSTYQVIQAGVPASQWMHVRLEHDGNTLKYNVSVNGALVANNFDFRNAVATHICRINMFSALEEISTFYTAYWGYSWDPSYAAGDNYPHVEWTITDPDTTNPTYSVYKNGSPYLVDRDWVSGLPINVFIGNLDYSSTNMTMIASDGQGNTASDEVIINFPNQIPILTSPDDLLVDSQAARGNYAATDQFNNGISPWYDVSQSGCSVSVASNVAGFASAMKYTDPITSTRVNGRRDVPGAPTSGWAEFWYYNDDLADCVAFGFLESTSMTPSATFFIQSGIVYGFNGPAILPLLMGVPAGQWTHLRMEMDGNTLKYNLTVNGGLVGNNLNFRDPSATHIDHINVYSGLDNITTFYTAYWGYSWDPEYSAGDNYPHVEWTITDPDTKNPTYTVYKNGTTYLSNQNWISGQYFNVFIGDLSSDNTNLTLVASDGFGLTVSDSVTISFPNLPPVINSSPDDLFIDEQTARGNYTATDQFNSGSLSPWYDVSQTGCSVTVASNVAGFARALKYTDPNTSWRANARRDVPEAPTVGWAEFWYYNDDPVDWVGIQFQAETLGVDSLAVFFEHGNIYAYNGSTYQVIQAGVPASQWMHVRLEHDGNTLKYNVSLNGVLVANNFDFRNAVATHICRINMFSALEDISTFYTAYWGYSWDPTYTAGDNFPLINWNITDLSTCNPTFSVYKNNSFPYLTNKQWRPGFPITFPLFNIENSESANFTIIADDGFGKIVSDTVNVRVQTNPLVAGPSFFNYVMGTPGGEFNWTIIDANTQDPTYTVFQNGSVWGTSGQLWTTGQIVSINISSLAEGSYNFTIIADDGLQGITSDEVLVTVFSSNTEITIEGITTISYELGKTNNVLHWNITDVTTQDPWYTIYKNDSVLGTQNLPWASGTNVTISIDNLAEGTHNFTIVAFDGLGLNKSHQVLVTVYIIDTNGVWQPINIGVQTILCKTSPTTFAELLFAGTSSGAQVKITSRETNPVATSLPGAIRFFSITLDGIDKVVFPVTAHFYYDPAQLNSNVQESNLAVYHYENTQWVLVSNDVNVELDYVVTKCGSFSEYAIAPAPPEAQNPPIDPVLYGWLIAIVAVALAVYGCIKSRNGKNTPTTETFPELDFEP